ncbi:MAG TPA: bifunctional UDP-sugar hydrolase/5'-nucleotidase, partial [bacterium]|nr:bifunctional UDP-sugar hydrolase/5'-nucleotidase [bacterium]
LHFNDLHGYLEARPDGGGAARIATIVKGVREENRLRGVDTLVLFGGDAFTGTLISNEYEGATEFDFLDSLGIDAMVIGNHEFDFGVPRFEELAASASFPILSANTFWKEDGRRFAKPCAVTGTGVSIVGLTTQQTRTSTLPENVASLVFKNPVKEAKSALRLKECRAPVSIALTHLGVRGDISLAKKVKDFDAVIGGHDHVPPSQYCRTVKKIPVCQTPANGKYVGRVDLTLDGGRVTESREILIPVDAKVAKDEETASLIERYAKNLKGKYDRVIGTAKKDMPAKGKGQTELGAIVAESMKIKGKAEIAFINTTGLRAPLAKGKIRLRDLAEVLPFRNYLVI